MQAIGRFFTSFSNTFQKQGFVGKAAIISVIILALCCLCSVPVALFSPSTPTPEVKTSSVIEVPETNNTTLTREPANTPESALPTSLPATAKPTDTAVPPTIKPTDTPLPPTVKPTDTPMPPTAIPTNTPLPPTATPRSDVIDPGTYIVGTDIKPGIYEGEAGYSTFESCYWARLEDLAGSIDSLIANDNSIGQFYVEVRNSDYALQTNCSLVFLSSLPGAPAQFPQKIMPGTYIIGVDIQPGTYRGQAGTDIIQSCYWARLKDVSGELDSVIANDNAIGQYYLQVQQSDFALSTACELERVGD